jgi:hypothetical protein
MGSFQEIYNRNRGDAAANNSATGERDHPEPGRIWLVEGDPAGLSPAHADLLLDANVVLYERALGAALAETLPTGIYAEPLPGNATAGPVISPRARHFAADGWRVVQLVERRDGRGRPAPLAMAEPDRRNAAGSPGRDAPASGRIFTANGLAG